MLPLKDQWLVREASFSAFVSGPLRNFWQRRQEGHFIGVADVPIRYVKFTNPVHERAIVLIAGRIECYSKYQELVYDLFDCGYDVLMMDHRGQGLSGRMLPESNRGHVEQFADYVTDTEAFWHSVVKPAGYRRVYALAHSMGGTMISHFLAKQPTVVDAVVLVAPMTGIKLPISLWLAKKIINWADRYPSMRHRYVPGTGKWRALPFLQNTLTHSQARYRHSQRLYIDIPALQVGGPTYHWVGEGIRAGEKMIALAPVITTPLLLLQASEDKVVDNRTHLTFCQALPQSNHSSIGKELFVIQGAHHEVLFECDAMRVMALQAVLTFFAENS